MKKVMMVFGTRPEAIKMCPLVNELKKRKNIQTVVCVSGQHREMLDDVLRVFHVNPDYDMNIMQKNQTIADITTLILQKITPILQKERPDLVLVHGDTSTAFVAALASFYLKIPVGHVEAGLRSNNMYRPFPEEFNRCAISLMAQFNFAPTKQAEKNLKKEGCKNIFVTGNTAIDALKTTILETYQNPDLAWADGSRLLLMTAHRRENIGEKMEKYFREILRIVKSYPDVKVIYPVHKNPKVREIANKVFQGTKRIRLIEPLDPIAFHNYMSRAFLILTDSGGIQEEAPALNKPVIVMREETERQEGLQAGTLRLASPNTLFSEVSQLLDHPEIYQKMAQAPNPYGDGTAAKQITDIIELRGLDR